MIRLPADIVSTAINYAVQAHAGQYDKSGWSYIAHPFRVALSVREYGQAYFIVGLLHDVVEDTSATLESVRTIFGDVVADAVDSVTRREPKTGHPEKERYFDFIMRARANKIGRSVKIADISDNLRPERLEKMEGDNSSLINRYRMALRILQNDLPEEIAQEVTS